MEQYSPKATCCGVPIIVWENEVWEGMCLRCKAEFAYFDPRDPRPS